MRRGELLGLRWADVDLDDEQPILRVRRAYVQYGALRVEKEPKTPRSRRAIALDAAALAALRRHSAAQAKERLAAGATYEAGDRVFADQIGRALSPDGVSKAFSAAVRAAGLPRITLHGLRHTVRDRRIGIWRGHRVPEPNLGLLQSRDNGLDLPTHPG